MRRIEKQRALPGNFSQHGNVGCDDRAPERMRFENREAKPLRPRWNHEGQTRAVGINKLRVWHRAERREAAGLPVLFNPGPDNPEWVGANPIHLESFPFLFGASECFQQALHILGRLNIGDEKKAGRCLRLRMLAGFELG